MESKKVPAWQDPNPTSFDVKLQRTKDRLNDLADRALRLSDRLGGVGHPMTDDDKQLVRCAAYPEIKEALREAGFQFLAGVSQGDITHRLHEVLGESEI
jgi:hypothetical protein